MTSPSLECFRSRANDYQAIYDDISQGIGLLSYVLKHARDEAEHRGVEDDTVINIVRRLDELHWPLLKVKALFINNGVEGTQQSFDIDRWLSKEDKKYTTPSNKVESQSADANNAKVNEKLSVVETLPMPPEEFTPSSSVCSEKSLVFNQNLLNTQTESVMNTTPRQKMFAPNDEFDCVLSHINSPESFYIVPKEYLTLHTELTNSMNTYYTTNKCQPITQKTHLLYFHQRNQFFAFSADPPTHWCRCKIENFVTERKDEVDVFCIDFGKVIRAKLTSVYLLAKNFYNYPPMAYHCSLFNVIPFKGNVFSKESVDYLKSYTYQVCGAIICSVTEDNKYSVLLNHKDVALIHDMFEKDLIEVSDESPASPENNENVNVNRPNLNVNNLDEPGQSNAAGLNTACSEGESSDDIYNEGIVTDFKLELEGNDYKDEELICKFYSGPPATSCFKKDCKKLHVPYSRGGWTMMTNSLRKIPEAELPLVGSTLTLWVSSVINFRSFYAQIIVANHAYSRVNNVPNPNIKLLAQILSSPETVTNISPLKSLPGNGECVAAKYKNSWYRGMVTSVSEHKIGIFYVDLGVYMDVEKEDVQELHDSLYTIPKQAIHCTLANVKSAKKGREMMAKNMLSDLTVATILEATVSKVSESATEIEVMLNDKKGNDVGLLMAGFEFVDLYSAEELNVNFNYYNFPG